MTLNSALAVAGAAALASEYNNLRKDLILQAGDYVTSGGSANAYTFNIAGWASGQITALVEGMHIPFKANFTNTGASTANVNAIGAIAIKLPDWSALSAWDITSGRLYSLRYDGTNFILQGSNSTLLATGWVNTNATNATFTADASTDVITSNGHNLQNGDKVVLTTSGTLPAGLALATGYFVRDRTANTFKLSPAPYDTAIDITDAGTGTHTWTNAQGTITLSFAAKTHLHIVMYSGVPTASSILRATVNGDGTGTYGSRNTSGGGAESINSTQKSWTELWGIVSTREKFCIMEILNIATIRKHGIWAWQTDNNNAAVAGVTNNGSCVWNNTADQITSLSVFLSAAAGMWSGAVVYVYGWN